MRIGIDLGGTKIEGIVMDPKGCIVAVKRVTTPTAQGYSAILRSICELVRYLERFAHQQCTVGIGTPGALSARTGMMKNSNTVCLNGKPLQADVEQMLQRKIRIENDANCFALSEATDGAARDHGLVFGVIMGTGVGGGVVFNGVLHRGPQHIAGEWGHNVLINGGRECYCGKKGCIETYLSGPGLVMEWYDQAKHNQHIATKTIVDQARAGDITSRSVMSRYFSYFGQAIAMVINMLDPDAIVLGGGMSNIDGLYTKGVQQVKKYVFSDELRTPILANMHGDSSGVRGAAQLWPAGI